VNIGQPIRSAAGWTLAAALVYAPWARGCVETWAVVGLVFLALACGGLLLLSNLILRRRPAIPIWCAAATGILLLQGWWMVLNAHGKYVYGGDIFPVISWWPDGPGAVDGPTCAATMWQITAALVALLAACDLASEPIWRRRFIWTVALTAVSISAYGLLQKAALVPALAHRVYADSVFATYDYHGNAGAFLNLGIPAVFAVAIGLRRNKWLGWTGLFICLAGAMANVSRAAMAITLVLTVLLFISTRQATNVRRLFIGALIALIVATAAGGGAAWRRWGTLMSQETLNNPRLMMYHAAANMAVDADALGYGPGSFKLIYFNSPYLPRALFPRWRIAPYEPGSETSIDSYVHNDYLQFIIEWGWIGAAVWASIIAGAVFRGLRALPTAEDRVLIIAALFALAGVFAHALVDWPLQVASLQLEVAIYLALLIAAKTKSPA
jgi:O-antigen ligase